MVVLAIAIKDWRGTSICCTIRIAANQSNDKQNNTRWQAQGKKKTKEDASKSFKTVALTPGLQAILNHPLLHSQPTVFSLASDAECPFSIISSKHHLAKVGDCAATCATRRAHLTAIKSKFQYGCAIAAVGHDKRLWTGMTVKNGHIWENNLRLENFARRRSSPWVEKERVGPDGTLLWPVNPARESGPVYLHNHFYVLATNDLAMGDASCLCTKGEVQFMFFGVLVTWYKGGHTPWPHFSGLFSIYSRKVLHIL